MPVGVRRGADVRRPGVDFFAARGSVGQRRDTRPTEPGEGRVVVLGDVEAAADGDLPDRDRASIDIVANGVLRGDVERAGVDRTTHRISAGTGTKCGDRERCCGGDLTAGATDRQPDVGLRARRRDGNCLRRADGAAGDVRVGGADEAGGVDRRRKSAFLAKTDRTDKVRGIGIVRCRDVDDLRCPGGPRRLVDLGQVDCRGGRAGGDVGDDVERDADFFG